MAEPKFLDLKVNCTVDLADVFGNHATPVKDDTDDAEVKE